MNIFSKTILFALFCMQTVNQLAAQSCITIEIPDAHITATKIIKGDSDTYGLGDWSSTFTIQLEDDLLLIRGSIVFSEGANDFTTIVGTYRQQMRVSELTACGHCQTILSETTGNVTGPNVGARGYQLYQGQGIVKRARIITDTFGEDAGNIGGSIEFEPIKILLNCAIAQVDAP